MLHTYLLQVFHFFQKRLWYISPDHWGDHWLYAWICTCMVLYACFPHVHYCTWMCPWLTHTYNYIYTNIHIIYYVKTYEFMNTRTYTRQQLIQQFWKLVYTCYWNCYHYCSKINVKWPILNEKLGYVNYNIILWSFSFIAHYATASLLWGSWTGSLSVNGEEQYMVGHKRNIIYVSQLPVSVDACTITIIK